MRRERSRGPARLDNLSLREQLKVDRLPLRLLQMMLGLTGFGVSLAMLLESGLGGAPWDVLHAAVADRIGLSVGSVSIAVSFVVLLLWIPLRERIGIGTVANSIWVGVSIDLGMMVLPEAPTLPIAVAMMLAGVILNGISGAVYIGAQLGAGPRDGLMTGLGRVLRRPVGNGALCDRAGPDHPAHPPVRDPTGADGPRAVSPSSAASRGAAQSLRHPHAEAQPGP